ncbi:MAG: DNA repair protein RecN [Myxococcaceae bacterium]
MLQALRIANFAVIEEVEVAFGEGLTVLTGETGAGKSIVVDALSLLLGGRADAEVIRASCDEAIVEGLFRRVPALAERLALLGLPDLGEEVSVRRVVGRTGRGKAYVNGALVTVGVLGQLMRGLVDIAGQHEHVGLFDASSHRSLVDRLGGLGPQLSGYQVEYGALRAVEARIEALGGDEQTAQGRAEFLRFQLEEIDRVGPKEGEGEKLEAERRRLASAEKLRRAAVEAESLLSVMDGSSLETLGRALALVADAAKLDGSLAPLGAALTGARAELDEASRALARYGAGLEADPGRLAEVDERLDGLRRLCRKHGAAPLDAAAVVAKRAELAAELSRLENRQGSLDELLAERALALGRLDAKAKELTAARVLAAEAFAQEVRGALAHLALAKAQFEVTVSPAARPGPDGADEIELLFGANPGEPARPLSKVASGGEASRLLLAIRRGLAGADRCEAVVLDEVDAGVSGGVAEVVGRMIKDVSGHRQVLCVTHLPQVAAFADAHLRIEKELKRGRTWSTVVELEAGPMRARELARMLSGVEVTPEALGAAEALLRSARARRCGPRVRRIA